jgi:hypothetical protein
VDLHATEVTIVSEIKDATGTQGLAG